MINERAIFNSLNYHANRDKRILIMRVALVTFLHYHMGYSRKDISKALCKRYFLIKHWIYMSKEYEEENDVYKETIDALSKSMVELIPKYETTIGNLKEIKISLRINNKEYKQKLI